MEEKKKINNIVVIFASVLFVIVIIISYENLISAVKELDIGKLFILVFPILITFGALVSSIVRRLKLNQELNN